MEFKEILKRYRKQAGLTQNELADLAGVSRSYYQKLEGGFQENPSRSVLEAIGRALGVSSLSAIADFSAILPDASIFPAPDVAEDTVAFPVIGDLAAGWDRVALEDYDAADRVEIPAHYLHGRPRSDFFCLRVKGQSMYPHYMEGDVVLIKKAPSLDHSGQVGAVRYEDYATLKKVEYVMGEDWMRLVPINPEFAPKMITGVDLEQCQVLGVPVLLIREVDNP